MKEIEMFFRQLSSFLVKSFFSIFIRFCRPKLPISPQEINSSSGGPLMIQTGGQFTLVGLSSFSVTDCAAPFPAVFTRITFFLEWMAAALTATM